MLKQLRRSSHDTISDDLHALLNDDEIGHLFNGAYILIQDNGLYYAKWKGLSDARMRGSSHHATDTQHSVHGQELSECLFATRKINGEECTWVQLEPYSRDLSHIIQHSICYLYYRLNGVNVGPRGTSQYTETTPLVIRKERIKPEVILADVVMSPF